MVGHIGKALRWFFGIQAVVFAAISIRFLCSLPRLLALENHNPRVGRMMGFWTPSGWLASALALGLVLTFVFAMAWWKLRRGHATGRGWAIAASVVSIPFFLMGPPARLSTVAGILGLIVFGRRSTAEQASRRTKQQRLPGDGTSSVTEWLAGAAMFAGVIFAGTLWSDWAENEGLPTGQSLMMRLLLIQLAALITTVVHECGHALAACALEMKIRHLILGPCEWRQKGGKWRFRIHTSGLLAAPGAVGAVPTRMDDLRWRFILFAAAGPLASLWLGVAALWATLHAKGMAWESGWKLLSYLATFSLIAFVLNLVPIAQDGQYSDGARIYQLLWRSGWGDVYQAFAMVGSTLVTPLRPRDWNEQVLERAATFLRTGQRAFLLQMNRWSHFFDCGKIAEAELALDEAEAVNLRSTLNLPVELIMEMVFVNTISKRYAAARVWWKRLEGKKAAGKEAESSVDYWKARCAVLLSEGLLEEAGEAWECGNAMARELPAAGAYEFDRYCLERLGQALEGATPPALPAAEAVLA
jgi:hypothetical protein